MGKKQKLKELPPNSGNPREPMSKFFLIIFLPIQISHSEVGLEGRKPTGGSRLKHLLCVAFTSFEENVFLSVEVFSAS